MIDINKRESEEGDPSVSSRDDAQQLQVNIVQDDVHGMPI